MDKIESQVQNKHGGFNSSLIQEIQDKLENLQSENKSLRNRIQNLESENKNIRLKLEKKLPKTSAANLQTKDNHTKDSDTKTTENMNIDSLEAKPSEHLKPG